MTFIIFCIKKGKNIKYSFKYEKHNLVQMHTVI